MSRSPSTITGCDLGWWPGGPKSGPSSIRGDGGRPSLAIVWWLADNRWDLGDEANKALDKWAIPVIPGLLQTLMLPTVVITGFVLALFGHAYVRSLKDTHLVPVTEATASNLDIELEPSVMGVDMTLNEHRLRLGVLNNGGVGRFYARVWDLRRIAVNAAPPWEIKWRQDDPDAYCWIKHGNKEILELATVVDPEPQGGLLLHFHGPRDDWHGVLMEPDNLDSGFIQVRVWHVELDEFVEAWFQLVIGEHRFPRLVPATEPELAVAVHAPSGGAPELPRSHEELVDREQQRDYVTQQIAVGVHIQRERQGRSVLKGFAPGPHPRETKWLHDTYYGLRDRKPEWANLFGDPDEWGLLDERINRLREILEHM